MIDELPAVPSILAVCAHPDDESFGMGAVIDAFVAAGTRVSVLSFTHGEASSLRGVAGELAQLRAEEFAAAARILGVSTTELLDYPDGHLDSPPIDELVRHVRRVVDTVAAEALLVFDVGGITGHPDHERATQAALAAAEALGVPVLAWVVGSTAATQLNREFGTAFVGRSDDEVDVVLRVDRTAQRGAIAEHRSQSMDNPVLWRRLELFSDVERLRWLRRPSDASR